MKRILTILLALMLCFCLSACSKEVGGVYKLEYITTDGVRISPSSLGMNISFAFSEDGTGTATYSGQTLAITWAEDDDGLLVTGPHEELHFSWDGSTLVMHDEGSMLFFTHVEEEEEDD